MSNLAWLLTNWDGSTTGFSLRTVIGAVLLRGVGGILVVASGLKAIEFLTNLTAGRLFSSSDAFLLFQVEFELVLGLWLLSGLYRKAAYFVTLFCFLVFAGVTLYKGLQDYESCGCFGRLRVDPWITLFAVDLPVLLALLLFPCRQGIWRLGRIRCPRSRRCLLVGGCAVMMVATTATLLVLLRHASPNSIASLWKQQRLIKVEPKKLVGQYLPLLDYIDISPQLRDGMWIIVFLRHNCQACALEVPKYEQLDRRLRSEGQETRVALIEVPPYAPSEYELTRAASSCVRGRLTDDNFWSIATPLAFVLENGVTRYCAEGISYR